MAKQKFERTKPHLNVGTMGHIHHGKTTLTVAITKVLEARSEAQLERRLRPDRQGARGEAAWDHDQHCPRRIPDRQAPLRARGHAWPRRLHQKHDHGCRSGRRRVLVVSAPDGPMPQTREHVLLARQVGVPSIVVALNKADAMDDEDLLELVELEVRELLTSYEFPGDDTPVIRVSALKALEGDADCRGGHPQVDGRGRLVRPRAGP